MKAEDHPAQADGRALRRELRIRRRAIPPRQRQQAAMRVARLVDQARWLRPGRRVGLYLSLPEELDTGPLMKLARRRGCTVAVPRIVSQRQHRMRFFEFDGRMKRGAYGILEPVGRRHLRARNLDIVFVPLVGFDAAGNRMGMGKGFYDRSFAHRGRQKLWRRPLLVGLAYDVQQVAALPVGRHDIRVDAIVTESTLRRSPGRNP